jgi:uncharacterized membrane protein
MDITMLESLGLGLGLGIAAGFRVVVPFWVLSVAAFFGHLPLTENLQWLGSETALIGLSIALVIELLAYSLPWLDNAVDAVALPIAAIAGTVLMALATNQLDPFAQWSLAIIAGGGAAATVKGLNGFTRLISTATTGGLTNFLIAIAELLGALALSILALTAPILAFVGTLTLLLLLIRYAVKAFYRSRQQPVGD